MRKFKVTFVFLAVALALSGCGIFGSSDGTDVSIAEDVEAQATVNSVQSVPAETPEGDGVDPLAAPADAALPTAVTLPTAAPTAEPTVDRSQPTTYIVQSGDVLGLIAERFDADIAELRRVNNLDGNLIRVGQELTIPALDGSTTTESSGESASGSSAAPAPAATRAPAASVSCSNAGSGHCIQPGDSLAGLAFKFDVTVDALRAANPGITGDLIFSGQVLNLPGSTPVSPTTPTNPSAPTSIVPAGTPSPAVTAGPSDDAACAARNPQFPYFHGTDGLCYANPIGATAVPTSVASETECPVGRFLWEDGLCYPIPGVTVTPTAGPTTTGTGVLPDYGTTPCRDGYLPLEGGRCWPAPDTTPATVVPVSQATATVTAGSTTECTEPNFFLNGTSCFLLPDGAAKGCTLDGNIPRCPAP